MPSLGREGTGGGVSALIEGRTEPQPEQRQTEPLGGTLAGMLSACLGALPPPDLWVPVLPGGSQPSIAQFSTEPWLPLCTPTSYCVPQGSLLAVLCICSREGGVVGRGPVAAVTPEMKGLVGVEEGGPSLGLELVLSESGAAEPVPPGPQFPHL